MLLTFVNLHCMKAGERHVISPVNSAQIGAANENIEEGAFLVPTPFEITRATALAAFGSTVLQNENPFIDVEIIASQGLALRVNHSERLTDYRHQPPWLPQTRYGFEYDGRMSLMIPAGGPGCILLRVKPSHDIPIRWFRLSLMLK